METFWNWFIGEAGAGWIVGLLALIWGFYTWRKSEKPPRVVVEEGPQARLLDIDRGKRNQIKVLYTEDGKTLEIKDLVRKEFLIYNEGTTTIKNVKFKLNFRAKEPLALCQLTIETGSPQSPVESDNGLSFIVTLDHLNSRQHHKHILKADLLSERPVEILGVEGQGEGWSTRYASAKERGGRGLSPIEATLIFMGLFGLVVSLVDLWNFALSSNTAIAAGIAIILLACTFLLIRLGETRKGA